jgi:hypothetical protein
MLKQRFHNASKRLGLNQRQRGILDMSEFRHVEKVVGRKPRAVEDSAQMKLF